MAKGKQQGLRLLFVCSGNTCRSPMAAGIAQKVLQGIAYVRSAGIYAYGNKAAQEAIEVMQRHLGIDISEHQPQAIENFLLNDFDYIIAMGFYEYEHLKARHQIIPSKLIEWDIEDPYGQGIEAYEKCASKIQKCMQELLIAEVEATTPLPVLLLQEYMYHRVQLEALVVVEQAVVRHVFTQEGLPFRWERTLSRLNAAMVAEPVEHG